MQISASKPRLERHRSRATTARMGALTAALTGLLLAVLPQAAMAGAVLPQSPESPVAEKVTLLYVVVLVLGVIAILGVIAAMVRGVRADGGGEAADNHAGRTTVIAGAVAVLLALLGAFVFGSVAGADPSSSGVGSDFRSSAYNDPTLNTPNNLDAPDGPSMTVRVNGQQFLWRYSYPGFKDTYSYHTLYVPTGVTVLLDVTSSDVEHSWWVPQLGGSIDALPGYINKGWIRVDKAGTYKGASTVVSGSNYASMTTSVVALPPEKFLAWVAGKRLEINAAMTALGIERTSGKEAELISGQASEAAPAPRESAPGQ